MYSRYVELGRKISMREKNERMMECLFEKEGKEEEDWLRSPGMAVCVCTEGMNVFTEDWKWIYIDTQRQRQRMCPTRLFFSQDFFFFCRQFFCSTTLKVLSSTPVHPQTMSLYF